MKPVPVDTETEELVRLALTMAASAVSVCNWFVPGFEAIDDLRAAIAAFEGRFMDWAYGEEGEHAEPDKTASEVDGDGGAR